MKKRAELAAAGAEKERPGGNRCHTVHAEGEKPNARQPRWTKSESLKWTFVVQPPIQEPWEIYAETIP